MDDTTAPGLFGGCVEVLEFLKRGNERFERGEVTVRDLHHQVKLTAKAQHPMAAILGCIDSRVSNELIFDIGLGDVFSARVAGNVVSDDVLGSLEYACDDAGAKLILVLGHLNCGAIKAACDYVESGFSEVEVLTHGLTRNTVCRPTVSRRTIESPNRPS